MTTPDRGGFGALLKRHREGGGLSQETLAERAGLSAEAISALERGARRSPHLTTVRLLADALGLQGPQRAAFEAAARGQRSGLPPATLPVPLTPLLGRAHLVAVAGGLLQREEVRLLTLTGPGGIGKTRLGLQVAADGRPLFPDGVAFVALAALRDPGLVAATIAQALGVREGGRQSMRERLLEFLRGKHLLLVLDNFEHMLAAAPLVAELLAADPALKVLVTSRAVLRLQGEQEFPVPPLALPVVGPSRERLPDVEALAQYAAVALFVQQAQAVQPDFALTATTAAAVAEICVRLDGLPLAIELAAARSKVLSPQGLLARLEHRLHVLTGGPRDLPARLQTMRDTIAWSHDLLDAHGQVLYARLAVFVGGWTLEAAEAVCAVVGNREVAVLDGLETLVNQSLVQQEEQQDGERRFRMLETIREYARERLEASGEAAAVQQQHAAYYLALAERVEPELRGAEQVAWLALLEREHDNLRAALSWAHERGDAETGLRLAGALFPFWMRHNHYSDGRARLAALLALPESGRSASAPWVRAKALHAAAELAFDQGDYQHAVVLAERSLAVSRDSGDTAGIARALHRLGDTLLFLGEYAQAQPVLEESLALWRRLDDAWGMARSLLVVAVLAEARGDLGRSAALREEGLALREHGRDPLRDPWLIAYLLTNLGDAIARAHGDLRRAEALIREGLDLRRAVGDTRGMGGCHFMLGSLVQELGDYGRAIALYAEGIPLFQSVGVLWPVAYMLDGLAGIARAWEQRERAVRLYGAAAALHDALGGAPITDRLAARDRDVSALRSALGEETFAAAWAAGQALPLDQAIAEALQTEDPRPHAAAGHRTKSAPTAPRRPGTTQEGARDRPADGPTALPLQARLRATRRARGLSLAAVGALFGVSHVTVSRWEAGMEPDRTGTVRGKPIPSELVPLVRRWIEAGATPAPEDLAARTTARSGVNPQTGKPWKRATL
jgi:predicted ATPase/transcriptional regulator with XRE-family HTH domain